MKLRPFCALLLLLPTACIHASTSPPLPCPPHSEASATSPLAKAKGTPAAAADLVVLLRPEFEPEPRVHVELDLLSTGHARTAWEIERGAKEGVARASARDERGEIAVTITTVGAGVALTLTRPPEGAVHLAYDLLAKGDAPKDPLGLLVEDGRFRGGGEGVIALPREFDPLYLKVELHLDGSPLRAPVAASSLGVGSVRRTTMQVGRLREASFLAGAMGAAVIDDPAAGHDEAAWLGFTAFDPRTSVVELAVMRTALKELFHSHFANSWTHLFVSESRAAGEVQLTRRHESALLQLGPGEPWSPALRLVEAEEFARRFIGGELTFATESGHEAEAYWFFAGVSRWAAVKALSQAGIFSPDDVRDAVASPISVLATSPYRAMGNRELAALTAAGEPGAKALAASTLAARGALYATRLSAHVRSRPNTTYDREGLAGPLSFFLNDESVPRGERGILDAAKWNELFQKEDPLAAKEFEEFIVQGRPFELPPNALGPCFRAGTGEYTAFDAGFDLDATRSAADRRATGVRPGGPAALAGLKEGDLVEGVELRAFDPKREVKLTVTRGDKSVIIRYLPRGARGKGQTFTRIRGLEDERCGLAP